MGFFFSLLRGVGSFGQRGLACAMACLALASGATAQPVADFFRLPDVARPALSPAGTHLAVLGRGANGRMNLSVMDLETRRLESLSNLEKTDVVEVHWVNSRRLVFVTGNVTDPVGSAAYWRTGGLFAVDRDGKNARRLALPYGDGSAVIVRPRFMRFMAAVAEDSDEIIVASNERNYEGSDVYRLNTRSARKTLLSFDTPGDVRLWALDRLGNPRGAMTANNLTRQTHYRATAEGIWGKWAEGDFREPLTFPVAVDYDGSIIGMAYRNVGGSPRDTQALVRLSATGAVTQVLAANPDYDVQEPVFDPVAKRLVGAALTTDRAQVLWFDERWAALQRQIDQAVPGAINLFVPPGNDLRMLVVSYTDKNPGDVYLFDFKTRKLEFIYASRPWIKPEQMGAARMVRLTARDGLPLTAKLTLPKTGSAKALPLVVIVHGGPWVPGYSQGFDAEAQFFASRGFAVMQPNFRGTTGLGSKAFLASFKQWGLAMQDDITDTAEWLFKQGIADRQRACIYGASYGGYAAMQAMVRTPDLFKCAVNYVGVTDLQLFQSVGWSDYADGEFNKLYAPIMVGDLQRDSVQLRATSPAQNASAFKGASFLAYGAEDLRVPLIHGERMRDALQRAGKPVEWMIKAEEGHGYVRPENRVEFYTRAEAFIRAHTAKP